MLELRDVVALSTGSACTTARVEPSHVILALGFSEERAHHSLRIGLGRFTTDEEVRTRYWCIGGNCARQSSGVMRE